MTANTYYWSRELAQWRTWERAAIKARMDFARIMVAAINKQVRESMPKKEPRT